jgi:hypothetical protein
MKAIHAICHRVNGKVLNLRQIGKGTGVFGSGWWKVTPEDAEALIGGWLYLHESSGEKSHFLGRIQSLGEPKDGAVEFVVVRRPGIDNQKWRGPKAGQNPVDNFRIVDTPNYPHELSEA